MDIYCPRCGEPCDLDELHDTFDEAGRQRTFPEATAAFYAKGCGLTLGTKACEKRETDRGRASAALREALGDDIDGIASMLGDYG